jgi:bifunctional DNase/RNase
LKNDFKILLDFFIFYFYASYEFTEEKDNSMIVAVRVERVTLDTSSNRFVVILKDDTYHRWLPIVVGPAEAQAIALHLEKVKPPRPMTHDLLKNILDSMKADVSRVVVNDLKENTYYAVIDLKKNGAQSKVDARPSDAIALALRVDAPIFVDEEVMQKASISNEIEAETAKYGEEEEVQLLNVELQKAIQEERYEDAARIRDKINDIQGRIPK